MNIRATLFPAAGRVCGALLLMGLAGTCLAQQAAQDCVSIEDPERRLACYDRILRPDVPTGNHGGTAPREPAAAPGDPVAEAPPRADNQPPPAATSTTGNDDFGLPPRIEGPQEELRTYTVAAARHNDFTGWTLHFTNGEVWKQIGTDSYDIEEGKTYTIQRNAFNSYFLGNADNRRRMRVERVE